jgi:sulfate adenylyltransferase
MQQMKKQATSTAGAIELITPYQGSLVNLEVPAGEKEELVARASKLPRIQLTPRNLCDLELLATGGFSPVDRFLGKEDYRCVIENMHLANGVLFPIPITLSVPLEPRLTLDTDVALADERNNLVAIIRVEEIYERNLVKESRLVCGTTNPRHPFVAEMNSWGKLNISGSLRVISLPRHYDFQDLRLTPAEARERLVELGHSNVVAFQTRNPIHRAHEEITRRSVERIDGTLLLHPVTGITKAGDIDHYTRVRSYKILFDRYYDRGRTLLALLPLAMRMAGPREAVWHAIIRRNFGANFLIVGRDHASPGVDSKGRPFYGPYDAQELVSRFTDVTGVSAIPFTEMIYLPEENRYEEVNKVREGVRMVPISGSVVRMNYAQKGNSLPDWFVRKDVAKVLEQSNPPRYQQGFCVWLTGLSAAGKSTTAEILAVLLLEQGRRVTLLDGDVIRTQLSKGLGFSREDRDINIRRIGFVASEITRHGGGVVCAAVSPFRGTRNECRAMIGTGRFIEVFVDTPLEICEQRDPKGMYSRARAGQIKGFTGIDDPYEPPKNPEIVIDTVRSSAEENAKRILAYLVEEGFICSSESSMT